jgi:MFS family permease
MPVFVTWLVYTIGWRLSFVASGVLTLVVGLPLCWFCIKPHRPEFYGLLPDGKAPHIAIEPGSTQVSDAGTSVKEALRMRAFWHINLLTFCQVIITYIPMLYLMPYFPKSASVGLSAV